MTFLVIADHASNTVPEGIDLGIPAHRLSEHIAIDIGAGALAGAVAARLGCSVVLGTVSRLVIDLNREKDSPGLIPEVSDGVAIPGNAGLTPAERERRLAAWHRPYHENIAQRIERDRPALLLSIHSFTPSLSSRIETRPWRVGILYNRDDRAAKLGLGALRARGLDPGDNQPYSGRDLNYTMNLHAEGRGLPYLGFEVRQDELTTPDGIISWAKLLADTAAEVAAKL